MAPNRPYTKGFLKRHKEGGKCVFLVGAEDLSDKLHPYHGPVAQVTWDDVWLNIVTDDYEGHAMLNIEALPFLREALAEIDKRIKGKHPKDP